MQEYVAPKYPRVSFKEDKRRKLSEADIAEMKSLVMAGWSYKRIGKYFGVSGVTAHYHTDEVFKDRINKKRYLLLKKQMTDPDFAKKHRDGNNYRFLERTKTDPLAADFKAKHTYQWKKKGYHTDPAFAEKTKKQAREAYYRNKETQ